MSTNTFRIFTDSGCDLSPALLAEWGIVCESLKFRFDDSPKEYANGDMPTKDFYQKMRDGGVAKTAAVNSEEFAVAFEKALAEGLDVLYIGFSSGISNTFNAGRIAAREMQEKYPDRRVLAVDSLCASAGEGLLLYLAYKKAKEGATIDDVAKYVEDTRLHICHWFTVDDLVYLKRGGRVSPTTALVGNMLAIKPVMHVDNAGKLIKISTAHGRKKAIAALAQHYTESATTPTEGHVFISHADCEADANLLAKMLKDKHAVDVEIITDVGPVIGAHSGPGTLALFYVGNER